MRRDQDREALEFALKYLANVATERGNDEVMNACARAQEWLDAASDGNQVSNEFLRDTGRTLLGKVADLRAAIRFEMWEILIPFLEVKRPTHEFGAMMFRDFFKWVPDDGRCTPEDLVGLLEEQSRKLLIAREHLTKLTRPT